MSRKVRCNYAAALAQKRHNGGEGETTEGGGMEADKVSRATLLTT